MTTPVPPSLPSPRQLLALLAVLALVVGACLGVYALTPVSSRPQLLDGVATFAPQLGTLLTAAAAYFGIRQVKGQQLEHSQQLVQITHQTNGVLSQRIADVVGAELDKRLGVAEVIDRPVPVPDVPPQDGPVLAYGTAAHGV